MAEGCFDCERTAQEQTQHLRFNVIFSSYEDAQPYKKPVLPWERLAYAIHNSVCAHQRGQAEVLAAAIAVVDAAIAKVEGEGKSQLNTFATMLTKLVRSQLEQLQPAADALKAIKRKAVREQDDRWRAWISTALGVPVPTNVLDSEVIRLIEQRIEAIKHEAMESGYDQGLAKGRADCVEDINQIWKEQSKKERELAERVRGAQGGDAFVNPNASTIW